MNAFGIRYIRVDGFVVAIVPKEGQPIIRRPMRPIAVRRVTEKVACGGGYSEREAA